LTLRPLSPLAAAISLALGISPTFAADTSDTLQEVVVTANRREQNVLDVPYNISALSGQALQAAGMTNLTDIARLLPGINVPDLGPRASSSNSNIVIRGLNANDPGSSAYLPWESVPLVSTYVDEVPMFVNMNLSDLQRVEVLRGPQGTLYGSGAVAGTIRAIHNQPDPKQFSANLSVDGSSTSHASDGSYTLNGLINIPISDTAALRMNAGYQSIAGFTNASNAVVFDKNAQPVLADPTNSLASGFTTQGLKGVDSARSAYMRASLLWHVTPIFDATLAYQRQDDHSNGFSRQAQGQSYVDQVLIPIAPDHRVVDLEALTLSVDAGFATVTSSTSFTKNRDQSTYDESAFLLNYNTLSPLYYGNYPRATTAFFTNSTDSSLVEELRLVSKAGGEWDYTVGGFFRHEYNDLFQYETVPGFAAWSELLGSANAANQQLNLTPPNNYNFANFGDFVQNFNQGTRPSALLPLDTNYTYLRSSGFKDRAVYGELTWHPTSKLQLTGGARVFWQEVTQNLYQTIPYGGPFFSTLAPPANATDALGSTLTSGDQKFNNHLFRFNAGYEITPTLRAYGTYSEGFRHGGTNAIAIGACAFCDSASTATFKPDTVKNFEIGVKGTVNNWLRFSSALYRMNWHDIQIQLFNATASAYVANGGTAVSQGIEMELEGQLGQGWSATLGYGYADAKVTGAFTVFDKGVAILAANDGDRLPYVPRQSLTAGVNLTHSLSSTITLDAHADASYRSDVNTQINSSATGYRQLGGFTTLNASATLLFSKQWRARVYGNNLTNQAGVSAAGPVLKNVDTSTNPDIAKYRVEYVMRPRTVGLALEYRFE